MKHCTETWPSNWVGNLEVIKIEVGLLPEPHDEDSFSMLRHPRFGIQDLVVDSVPQIFGQGSVDNLKRSAPVMVDEVLHVLEQKCARPMCINDPGNIKEQRPLCFAPENREACSAPFFFETPAIENGWHGKPASRTSVFRNLIDIHLGDVTSDFMVAAIVR